MTAGGGGVELACDGADEGPREHSRFLIARRDAEDADVLVLGLPDGQTALPVTSAGSAPPIRASKKPPPGVIGR